MLQLRMERVWMFSKKKFVLFNKINILLLVLLLVIKLMPITLSKYESVATGNADVNIAFYLIEPDYYTENIKLTSLSPSDVGYVYNFSVSNYNDTDKSEVDIEYDLSLVTTTNLPLRYELYMNESYNDVNSVNLINDNNTVIEPDSDGTYFKTIALNREELLYSNDVKNDYTLVVYYDKVNDNAMYQNMVESIRIVIDSRQILES